MNKKKRWFRIARWSAIFLFIAAIITCVGVFLDDYREYKRGYKEFQFYQEYGPLLRQSLDEKKYLAALAEKREEVYTWENSYDKTMKINEIDRLILEAAECDFSGLKIQFIGDSITFGTGGVEREDGSKISYVEYVSERLQFDEVLKEGMPGRVIADNGYPIISLQRHIDEIIDTDCDIIVIFCGLNDYLAEAPTEDGKIWGKLDDGSGQGYCGQLQALMQGLNENYPGKTFFFVTCYQIATRIDIPFEDYAYEGVPTLNDFMEQQRVLGERYGYPIIELNAIGFMDMRDKETAMKLSWDHKEHPNDSGYRVLGEHIAAELILYFEGCCD